MALIAQDPSTMIGIFIAGAIIIALLVLMVIFMNYFRLWIQSVLTGDRLDLKGTQAVPQLNAGQTFSLQVSVEIRDGEDAPPSGSYKLQACADGGKVVVESNEDDNCFTSSGIVKVVGPPDLMVTSVTVRNAPLTVSAAKQILNETQTDESVRDMAKVDRLVAACFASEDYKEGRRAFMEKRKPNFQGR